MTISLDILKAYEPIGKDRCCGNCQHWSTDEHGDKTGVINRRSVGGDWEMMRGPCVGQCQFETPVCVSPVGNGIVTHVTRVSSWVPPTVRSVYWCSRWSFNPECHPCYLPIDPKGDIFKMALERWNAVCEAGRNVLVVLDNRFH